MQHSPEQQAHMHAQPSLWAGHITLGRLVLAFSFTRTPRSKQIYKPLFNRLALLRQERGLAREELATRLQIHPSTLSALEKGSYIPSLSLALKLSEFFELPIEAIFLSAGPELA